MSQPAGPEQFFTSRTNADLRITDDELIVEGLRTRRFRWDDARRARLVWRAELNRDGSALDGLNVLGPQTGTAGMLTASDQRMLHIDFPTGKVKIDLWSQRAPDFEAPKQVEAIVRAHLEPYVAIEEVAPRSRLTGYASALVRLWGVVALIVLAAWAIDHALHLGFF